MDWSAWEGGVRRDVIRAVLVSPHDLTSTVGELHGLDLSGCSVSEGYYTDTRSQAQVTTSVRAGESDGYVANAWVRLVHEVPSWGYSEDMGTFLAHTPKRVTGQGATVRTYSLDSALYALSTDPIPWHLTVGAGSSAVDAAATILDTCSRPYVALDGTKTHTWGASKVYERCATALSDLFDVCSTCDLRLSVDGLGRVTLAPYVEPSALTPVCTISTDSGGMVIGTVSWSGSDAAGRSIVQSGSGDTELVGFANAPVGSPYSSTSRGYMVGIVHQVQGDQTQESVDHLAAQNLASDMTPDVEAELTTRWLPLHQGHCVTLVDQGDAHHMMVKSIDRDLGSMTCKLTLKEV